MRSCGLAYRLSMHRAHRSRSVRSVATADINGNVRRSAPPFERFSRGASIGSCRAPLGVRDSLRSPAGVGYTREGAIGDESAFDNGRSTLFRGRHGPNQVTIGVRQTKRYWPGGKEGGHSGFEQLATRLLPRLRHLPVTDVCTRC